MLLLAWIIISILTVTGMVDNDHCTRKLLASEGICGEDDRLNRAIIQPEMIRNYIIAGRNYHPVKGRYVEPLLVKEKL